MDVEPIFAGRNLSLDPSLCFVLMPFRSDLNPVYEDHIKKVAQAAGLQAQRADDIFSNSSIMEDIWKSIVCARVILADMTGKNPNVFYEMGIAHAIGKTVVLLTQSLDDVPFDLRHLRHVQYEYTPRGMVAFEQQLHRTLLSVL
jgi:hypothetical protein